MKWFLIILSLFAPLLAQDQPDEQLYLSLNIDDGAKLELSDGSIYAIALDDQLYSAYWITPFPVRLSSSGDPDFPVRITNLTSGTSVKGRPLDPKETLNKEAEKRAFRQKTIPPQQDTPKK